jgi:hypothetical protein
MSEQRYISFGGGVRLMAESVYIEEVDGLTKRGFRSLCRALSVPLIEIGDTRYVEMTTFLLAMRSICRIGEPDFLVPGCKTIRRNKVTDESRTLNKERFVENMESVLAELMAARILGNMPSTGEVKKAARIAAERLAESGLQSLPSQEQLKNDKRSIKLAEKKSNPWEYRSCEEE